MPESKLPRSLGVKRRWALSLTELAAYAGTVWSFDHFSLPHLGEVVVIAGAFVGFRGLEALLLAGVRRRRDEVVGVWRQEGQQVKASLEAVKVVLESAPGAPAAGPGAVEPRSPEARVEALVALARRQEDDLARQKACADELRSLLSSSPRLSGLFEAHLAETEGSTETAMVSILGRLNDMNNQIDLMLKTLDRTLFDSAELYNNGQQKVADNRRIMEEVNHYKHGLDDEIQLAIASLGRQVDELKPFTDLIRDVTERTNVLAINASIEAARAGKSGAGFAIIAGQVRQLSQQVALAATNIEVTVQKVSLTVNERLNAVADQLKRDDEAAVLTGLAAALPRLTQDFHTTVEVLNRFAQETHDSVGLMKTSILEVLQFAQFQDITRQQIEQVRAGLRQLGEQLGRAAEPGSGGGPGEVRAESLDEIAEAMNRNYTMMLQRRIHQKAVEGTAPAAEDDRPAIELF